MLDAEGRILYVGKARNLKRRVSSYFRQDPGSAKTVALMAQTARVEVTVTHTETESLLLENDLIKAHRPRYNVLLRDDKSYPYLHLTAHAYPRLEFYRGARREGGRFFGPFPSTGAVRESLNHLQRLFRLRDCSDVFFSARSRPCLQHQIGRCSAPCVGLVSAADYAADVEDAVRFLQGRDEAVVDALVARMEAASAAQRFEAAAELRDRIRRLRQVQEHQRVSGVHEDSDAIAVVAEQGLTCVAATFIRGGRNLGTRSFFPSVAAGTPPGEVLDAFVSQYYPGKPVPSELLLSAAPEDPELLAAMLSAQAGRRVLVKHRVRGQRAGWVAHARDNARDAIRMRLAEDASAQQRIAALAEALALPTLPRRIECFDVSHTQGEATVASCVVFVEGVAAKAEYRRFNIAGAAGGDDYGALREALGRRYARLKKGEAPLPDLLLIDGGRGQLGVAQAVLQEQGLHGVPIVGVAKGAGRRPGLETLVLGAALADAAGTTAILPPDSSALHLVQQVRDEAHRFAITGMRARRARTRSTSPLEAVPGLGPRRRAELLKRFGGLQGVARAGVEDLMQVKGISRELARRIHGVFHEGNE
jgi:excinuclease ABC subunit C